MALPLPESESNVSSAGRATVALLGPAPGILLGIISGFIYLKCRQPLFLQFGLTSVLINGFNLLPIYPLDGGRFMEIVLFSRHPIVEVVFKALAALALAGLAISLPAIVLGILAFITLIATREAYFQGKIARRLRVILQDQNPPATEKIPVEQLEAILPELSMGLPPQHAKVKTLANRADAVWRRVSQQAPKLGPSMALVTVYCVILLLELAGAIGFLAANYLAGQNTVIVRRTADDGSTASFEEKYWNQHKIWEVRLNDQGLYDGPSTTWTPTGVKKLEGSWAKGFWQGDWKSFDETGNIVSVVTYDSGRPSRYQTIQNGASIEVGPEKWPAAIKRNKQSSPRGTKQKRQSE